MKEMTGRQKQIIDASLEIISSKGIQNLTIKTLSEKVRVTEGAIYRHFKSKTDILASIAELFKSSSTEILNRIIETEKPGVEKIKLFFTGRLEQFAKKRGLMLVMFSEDIFKGDKIVQKKIHETINSHRRLIIQAVKEDQATERIRKDIDPENLFIIIMGALRLLVTRWRGSDFKFDLAKEGEKLWNTVEKLISSKI